MNDLICPNCKTKKSDFLETGLLGCPECYIAFEKSIDEFLKNIGQSGFHSGKKPIHTEEERNLLLTYQTLFLRKERAGLEGRFNDMAKISKEINALREELKDRGLL